MASNDLRHDTCLTDAELAAFHAHELGPEEAAAFAEHLAHCPACAARDRALVDEHQSWIARVQSAGPALKQLLDQQPRTALVPRTIAGYEILGELRRGGQGIVYRAIQQSTKREVAIKILLEGRYAAPGTRRRFEREIELVATLRHPHIVTVFDSGQTAEGDLYCVMDLLRGKPLDQYVAHRRPQRDELLRLFVQICRAVNYAHQRGVLHRDLKPSNILVDDDGEPHVLDFGLARPLAHGQTITGRGGPTVAGTLPYISPEQARGLPDALDVRSDVHALGVIVYELLTRTYPYPLSDDIFETLRHIAQRPPVRPGEAARARRRGPDGNGSPAYAIDAELEAIVLKALAKQRDHRYQTAGDLADDISRYLRGEPIAARRDSALANWYVLRKTLHRYRATAAVAGAFALVVLVGGIVSTVLWRQAVEQRDAARVAEAKARERFDQLHDLARFFTIDVQSLMTQLPGAAPVRAQLVEKGQAYLELLAADAADNVDMLLEIVGGHINLGNVLGATEMSNLGRFDEAMVEYRRALEVIERVRVLAPDRPEPVSFSLLARLRIADILQTQGRVADAISTYKEVIRDANAAIEKHPDFAELRRHLAGAHDRLGVVFERQGDLEAARSHFDRVAELTTVDPNATAAGPNERRAIAVTVVRQATRAYNEGRREEALEHYRRFLELVKAAREDHPDFFAFQRDVLIGHQWIGIILAELGQTDEAIESLTAALETGEALLAVDPTHDAVRGDMATTCIKLAEAQLTAGGRDASEQAARQCIELCQDVLEREPGLGPIRRLLGVGHYKLFEIESARAADEDAAPDIRQAHQQAACDALAECLAQFERMQREGVLNPTDASVPSDLTAELADCRAKLSAP